MIKALVIVPYEGLFEMMKEIQHEVNDIELHVELGNLYEGAAIAREARNNGYDFIISRGGTASMIQEAVSIPVIDIPVSGYDVLRIITLVKGFSRKAAILGFSNITHGAATICRLLDFDIKTETVTKDTEVEEKLLDLKKHGYEVVIGDVVTVRTAMQLGLTGVLITSGKEAIHDALDEARRSYRIFSRLQRQTAFFQEILDCGEQAIAVFDPEERLVYRNERFTKEFPWLEVENFPEIKKLLHETSLLQEKQTRTVTINQSPWKLTACKQEEGVVLFFEKNPLSPVVVQEGDRSRNAIEFHTPLSNIPLSGKSESIQKVRKQIDEYSKQDQAVWISGEPGTGRDLAASSIYLNRKTGNVPLIIFHCDVISAGQLKDVINGGFTRTYAGGAIYLKNIDKLDLYLQKELYRFIVSEENKQLRWLVSSGEDIDGKVHNGTFDRQLYTSLSTLRISIPPLRERKEDIEDLVHVFISELHPKYGNEVVGIRMDALEELVNFDWPGNVEQLKQVIEQLFLQTHSFYIEKENVKTILKRLQQKEKKDGPVTPIDISGTLEEIEKQVINKVLEEEGQNQSKAAKRLGINRSTLWRKLK